MDYTAYAAENIRMFVSLRRNHMDKWRSSGMKDSEALHQALLANGRAKHWERELAKVLSQNN